MDKSTTVHTRGATHGGIFPGLYEKIEPHPGLRTYQVYLMKGNALSKKIEVLWRMENMFILYVTLFNW